MKIDKIAAFYYAFHIASPTSMNQMSKAEKPI